MNVMIVSPEAVPFAKTGGLADVAGALPKYLPELGVDACLVMPLYGKVTRAGVKLTKERVVLKIPVGQNVINGSVWTAKLPGSDVTVYFIDNRELYGRPELYGEKGKDYADNCKRFIFFCRGVLELIKALDLKIDVLHLNDWQAGLIPVYIKTLYAKDPKVRDIATLFTVHNLAYQGVFWHWDLPLTGLPWDLFNWTELEFYGKLNFMKGALVFSDALNTVSKTYAKEIQTEEFGSGLEGVLTQRRNVLFGVVNGVDYDVWNPEVDDLIPAKFSVDDLSGKAKCKAQLQADQKLPVRADIPLIGLISRLVDQKGLDIISKIFEDLMDFDVQFVLLGTGDPKYHKMFEKLAKKYPDKFAANITFDNQLAHTIEAGCDMYLMPSRYEPCGLNQIYSLRYGTVPIVTQTGGLKDTIVNLTDQTVEDGTATGLSFGKYAAKPLFETLKRALAFYGQKKGWKKLVTNCMNQDWSWTRAAREYIDLYNKAVELKRRKRTPIRQKVGCP